MGRCRHHSTADASRNGEPHSRTRRGRSSASSYVGYLLLAKILLRCKVRVADGQPVARHDRVALGCQQPSTIERRGQAQARVPQCPSSGPRSSSHRVERLMLTVASVREETMRRHLACLCSSSWYLPWPIPSRSCANGSAGSSCAWGHFRRCAAPWLTFLYGVPFQEIVDTALTRQPADDALRLTADAGPHGE